MIRAIDNIKDPLQKKKTIQAIESHLQKAIASLKDRNPDDKISTQELKQLTDLTASIEQVKTKLPPDTPNRISKRYSFGYKLMVLARLQNGESINHISVTEGISKNTISVWRDDPELVQITNTKGIEQLKKNFSNAFYLKSATAMNYLTPDKLQQTNAQSLAWISAVLFDKARLADGLSTENVSVRGIVDHFFSELDDIKRRKDLYIDGNNLQ